MKEENIVKIIEALFNFTSSLIWPAVAFFSIYYFRREIAELIENIKNVKYPGGEVTIQKEDPEATKPEKGIATQEKFVEPSGFYTVSGLSQLIDESGFVENSEKVIATLKLFDTSKQHTWLLTTRSQLFCVLDDENTRLSGRMIQWKIPLEKASPVRARTSSKGNAVVDIGPKRSWLYSRRIHTDEELFENDIRNLIEKGRNSSI